MARAKSRLLPGGSDGFSCLNPYSPKSPFDQLLIYGFDAEKKAPVGKSKVLEEESDGFDDELDDGFDDDDGDEDGEGESEEEGSESNEQDEEEGEGVEDKFLKIKELKDYLKKDEAGEFGLKKKGDSKNKMSTEEDDEDDDELGLFGDGDDDEEEGADKLARYDDFFGATKKKTLKRESGLIDGSEDSLMKRERRNRRMKRKSMTMRNQLTIRKKITFLRMKSNLRRFDLK